MRGTSSPGRARKLLPAFAFLASGTVAISLVSWAYSMGNKVSSTGAAAVTKGWQPRAPDAPAGVRLSRSGYDITPLTAAQREAEAAKLSRFERDVVLNQGTERAFTGKTVNGYSHDNKQPGTYVSALGGLPLFKSSAKFDSGTGWPSFYEPVDPEHIIEVTDLSIPFMPRVEVVDRRSGAHLGHVFDDGPRPTGKRYCINAAALKFIPESQPLPPESRPASEGGSTASAGSS